MPQALAKPKFVELGRTFAPFEANTSAEEDADESYLVARLLFGNKNTPDWNALLLRYRTIILGEAGSGKTWEMEEQVRLLKARGEPAFFIRLDELAYKSCAVAMTEEPYRELQLALRRGQTVSLFLDSIDEAKLLSPACFRVALKSLREALPLHTLGRIKFFISTRISAWDSNTELPYLSELFSSGSQRRKVATASTDSDDFVSSSETDSGDWQVFKIQPLDRDQVSTLARACGMEASDPFLQAIDHAHAWDFARRPADVRPLIVYWLNAGRLGTLTELLEFDVLLRLSESRQSVPSVLSEEEARLGAETLAAACVLCQTPTIRLPSAERMVGVIEGQMCLPAESWTREKFHQLLDRPIFDEANLGKVRFHHRRTREYLAACWINRQMIAGCPLEELEDIFFDQVGGVRVLRMSLAPVAAWLCGGREFWHVLMQQWVSSTAPEIVFRYGDPKALPTDFQRYLLGCLTTSAKSAQHLWLKTDHATLSRFSGPELADVLAAIVTDQTLADDFRFAAMGIIKLTRVSSTVAQVLSVFSDPTTTKHLKAYAGLTLVELGNEQTLASMAAHLAELPELPLALVEFTARHLFPREINVEGFVELLRRVVKEPDRRHRLDGELGRILEEKLDRQTASTLATLLVPLVQEKPRHPADHEKPALSQLHGWLRPLLRFTSSKLLASTDLSEGEVDLVAESLVLLGGVRSGEQSPDPLDALSHAHPKVRRKYLWSQVRLKRLVYQRGVQGWLDLMVGHDFRLNPVEADIEWLVEDAKTMIDSGDRILALRLGVGILHSVRCSTHSHRMVRTASLLEPALRSAYGELLAQERMRPFRRVRYQVQSSLMQPYSWKRQVRRISGAKVWLSNRIYVFRNRGRITRGESSRDLASLLRYAEGESRNQWAAAAWEGLEKKWGKRTCEAVRTGCINFWPKYVPRLPYQKESRTSTPIEIVVGLTGILAAWEEGSLDFNRVSDDEVDRLTRYACEELNGFPPWFQDLVNSRSNVVAPVLIDAVRGEWYGNDPSSKHPDVLHKLSQIDCRPLKGVAVALSDLLSREEPKNPQAGALGISVWINCSGGDFHAIKALGSGRACDSSLPVVSRARWLVSLLRIGDESAQESFGNVSRNHPDADKVITSVLSMIAGRLDGQPAGMAGSFLTTKVLSWLAPLAYRHVRPANDIHRNGGYTPTDRDEAQRMRSSLVSTLAVQPDLTVPIILESFATLPEMKGEADWFRHLRLEALRRLADCNPWSEENIRQFGDVHRRAPRTASDLFRITLNRLRDIKKLVELSSSQLRESLQPQRNEAHFRRWIADQLQRSAREQFTAPQESVIWNEQRPDIRIQHPTAGSVSIEIKKANDWSFNDLMVALEVQLVTSYLRDHDANHGILLLGMEGAINRRWTAPDGRRLDLAEVVTQLEERAKAIEASHLQVKRVTVISIDFRPPRA